MWTEHVTKHADPEDVGQRAWAVRKLLLFFHTPLTVLSFAVAVLVGWICNDDERTFVTSPFLAMALLSFLLLLFTPCAVAFRSRPAIVLASVLVRLLMVLQAALALAFVVVATYVSCLTLLYGGAEDDDDNEDDPEGLELWAKYTGIVFMVVIAAVIIFVPMMTTQLLLVWRLNSFREALTQQSKEGYMEMAQQCISLEGQALLHPKKSETQKQANEVV
ncbi:hypothetical protein QOT17_021401 [Balamuthia mandrillaris]